MSADADISRRTSLALAGPAGGGTAGKYLPGALTRKRRTALDNVAAAVSGHPVATLTVGFLLTLTFISVFVFMAMTLVLLPVAIAALLLGLGAFVVTYFGVTHSRPAVLPD